MPRVASFFAAAGFAFAAGGVASGQPPGAAADAEARRLLAAGEGAAAVGSAFDALLASEEFFEEDWSAEAPEGGIVLDEFTGAAAAAYRRARAGYRLTLGDALLAAGDTEGAEVEYRRAVAFHPGPEGWQRLADLPDLAPAERVAMLLRTWAAAGGGGEALDRLRESGVYRTEAGLAAALDRFRFRPGAFRAGMPEGLAPEGAPFPALTLAVEGGAWSSARSFSEGRSVLLYYPGPGCGRCGEVIADLQVALRDRPTDLIAAVADRDLAVLGRIAELTGAGLFQPEPRTASERSTLAPRPIGHVVRRDALAFGPGRGSEETLWLAARSGLSVWRVSLDGGSSVRRTVEALFRFLGESPVPGGPSPLVEIPTHPKGLIAALAALEAGDEPIADLEGRLLRMTRSALREARNPPERAKELLEAAAALSAGDAARLRLLTELLPRFGDRLLQAAERLGEEQEVEVEVVRAVPGGRLRVAAGVAPAAGGMFGILREYERRDGATLVLAAMVRPGDPGEIRALGLDRGRAERVIAREDGFLFLRRAGAHGDAACVAWGTPEGPLTGRCPASVHRGAAFVSAPQLVGVPFPEEPRDAGQGEGRDGRPLLTDAPDAPRYRLRVDGGPSLPEVEALTRGLAAFAAGDHAGAAAEFEAALPASGPGSPVDRAALRYNLALVDEARGDPGPALARLLTIADSTFSPLVEAAVRRLLPRSGG